MGVGAMVGAVGNKYAQLEVRPVAERSPHMLEVPGSISRKCPPFPQKDIHTSRENPASIDDYRPKTIV